MALVVPTSVPTQIRMGDTVKFDLTLSDFPTSEGWVAAFSMVKTAVVPPFNATGSGTVYSFTLSAAATLALTKGIYGFVVSVSRASPAETYTIQQGTIEVLENLKSTTGLTVPFEARTHARRMLALIESALEGRIPNGMQGYSIAGTSISKISFSDLLLLRNKYRAEVESDLAKERGTRNSKNILFAFRGPNLFPK